MRNTLLASISISLAACGAGSDPSETSLKDTIAHTQPFIMVANVENAFDGVDQGTEYKEYSSKTSNWSEEVAQAKARRVAKVFEAANCPKIIVSAEVENQTAADMIAAAASNCHYKAYSANEPQTMPIGVAIFTSLPVKSKSLIETGYRPHLRLDFEDGLTVIGVHFKSMRDGGEELRQKAAEAVAQEMRKQGGKRTIVAGDFNTEEDLLKSASLTYCSAKAKPTHIYHGDWHRLDKIYATNCGRVERLEESFLMKGGQPYRSVMHDKNGKTYHEDAGFSDHLPLYMMD